MPGSSILNSPPRHAIKTAIGGGRAEKQIVA
jgi:hypothetical protein